MDDLRAPTPPNEIKQRQGPGGKKLDYIDARFVMDRLDAAVGPENWRDVYEDTGSSVRCGLSIRVNQEWITKWDVGDQSDIEPTKGAHSDAFKRAAVKWGIARDLYGDHGAPRARQTAPAPQQQAQAAPRATDGVGLTAKQFFEAVEASGIDRKRVSDAAKDLFKQWQVTALTNEQRATLLDELIEKRGPVDRPRLVTTDVDGEPEPIWEGRVA